MGTATAAKPRTPIYSGFCSAGSKLHSRCPVVLGTRERNVPCACSCHAACPTCGQTPAVQQ